MARPLVGFRLRQARRERGVTQAALAGAVGISPSYLNLIEHGKRDIGGALLIRLAEALGLAVAEMTGAEATRLVHDLGEIEADPLLQGLGVEPAGAAEIAGRHPGWARAVVKLHRSHRRAAQLAETLAERLAHDSALVQASHDLFTRITSVRSFAEILREHPDLDLERRARFTALIAEESGKLGAIAKAVFDRLSDFGEGGRPTTPAEEVDDLMADVGNFFPILEDAANALVCRIGTPSIDQACLTRWLEDRGVTMLASLDGAATLRSAWFDAPARTFCAPMGCPPQSIRFELARAAFALEAADVLAELAADPRLTSEEARRRATRALCGYGAAAMIMPYDAFRAAAEATRYDIDRLAAQFSAGIEQVCHRLVTLRRPGAEGVPFAFLRVDPAGNISKRFSLPDLRLPRSGGVCPLWAVYKATEARGAIVTQRIRLPDSRELLLVARSMTLPPAAFGAPGETYSVMLACDAAYADLFVYADSLSARFHTLRTGVNCHLCPREDCRQRAFPQVVTTGAA